MPRGRHRHSPPLHRLLPPSAIAGVSVVCALGPWLFAEPVVLRGLAAAAAVTAVVGAVVMRRWDTQAGRQVADLTRARASDEWRFEERVAELETDLDESRELRVKLEQRLRAKRAELAGLRNEHAALLRRYATAETERASALEGRRLLEIEAVTEMHALPAARVSEEQEQPEPEREPDTAAAVSGTAETADVPGTTGTAEEESAEPERNTEAESGAPAVFSPEGSRLFLKAQVALAKLDPDAAPAAESDASGGEEPVKVTSGEAATTEAAQEDEAEGKPEAVDEHARAAAAHPADDEKESPAQEPAPEPARETAGHDDLAEPAGTPGSGTAGSVTSGFGASGSRTVESGTPASETPGTSASVAPGSGVPGSGTAESEAPASGRSASGTPGSEMPASGAPASVTSASGAPGSRAADAGSAASEPERELSEAAASVRAASMPAAPAPAPAASGSAGPAPAAPAASAPAASGSAALVPRPAGPVQRPAGHFTVPTAVAVVPAAQPVRRPAVEGGFDFFGTKSATPSNALEAVQNEDLADVVGQEALALHKAEAEAEFKPAGEEARGVGQVIDLTAHDETEVIDLQGLRSAVS